MTKALQASYYTPFKRIQTMSVLPKREAVFIEIDEEDLTSMPPKKRFESILDESMMSAANELLALSRKEPLPCFRPLRRPQSFYPPHHTSRLRTDHTIAMNKNGYLLAAISDDEDDRSSDLFATSDKSHPLNKPLPLRQPPALPPSPILMGRPLPPPPRLPQLAPGQLVVIPPPRHIS